MVAQSTLDIINDYLLALKKNNIHLGKVFLYGSYANESYNENSDIDLMLISDYFDDTREKYLGVIWKLTEISNFKIEPFTIGSQRFETDDYSPLVQIVKKEGIEIPIP